MACDPDRLFAEVQFVKNLETLRKVDNVLNKIRIIGLVLIMAACIGMCTMNIILRYVVRGIPSLRPFPWVNELMQMGAVWIAFLAAGLGVKSNSHISLESLTQKYLPEKVAKILKKVAQVVVLVALAILIYFGIKTTISQADAYLENLRISNAWFYSAIPVGCGYLFYDYLLIFIFGEHPFVKKDEPPVGEL